MDCRDAENPNLRRSVDVRKANFHSLTSAEVADQSWKAGGKQGKARRPTSVASTRVGV